MSLDATIRAAVVDLAAASSNGSALQTGGLVDIGTLNMSAAFVMTAQSKVRRLIGAEVVEGPTVLFLENLIVNVEDQLTLPDGTVAPVKAVEGVADPTGGVYYAQAECGRPERGMLS